MYLALSEWNRLDRIRWYSLVGAGEPLEVGVEVLKAQAIPS